MDLAEASSLGPSRIEREAAVGDSEETFPAVALRQVVTVVMALNLGYFGIEFAVASVIGSVSLFADSIAFLEDTAVNAMILIGLAWSPRGRARLGEAPPVGLRVPALRMHLRAHLSVPRS